MLFVRLHGSFYNDKTQIKNAWLKKDLGFDVNIIYLFFSDATCPYNAAACMVDLTKPESDLER